MSFYIEGWHKLSRSAAPLLSLCVGFPLPFNEFAIFSFIASDKCPLLALLTLAAQFIVQNILASLGITSKTLPHPFLAQVLFSFLR